jgi:hypothetical protein
MCPLCMTTAALVAAGTTSGAGVLGFVVVVKFRALRRQRREPRTSQPKSMRSKQ